VSWADAAAGRACARLLSGVAWGVLRIRRRHVEGALLRAGLAVEWARRMYDALGLSAVELLWMAFGAGKTRRDLSKVAILDPDSAARLAEVLAEGRGPGWPHRTRATGTWPPADRPGGPLVV
jgi:hypothetical protein